MDPGTRNVTPLQNAIMENTKTHLAYLDRDLNFLAVNTAYSKGCGFTKEELIGRNHFDLFPNSENEAIFRKVRDTGEPVEYAAKPFLFPNAPERGVTYWDWTLVPVKNEAGEVDGLVLSMTEVTDRMRIEQELERQRKKFQSLFYTSNEGMALQELIFDDFGKAVDYRLIDVNPAFENITRIPRDQAVGQLSTDLYGTESPPYLDIYSRVVETGNPTSFETYFAPMKKYFLISAFTPEYGQLATMFLDITERKRWEDSLKESGDRLHAMIEKMPVAVVIAEPPSGRVLYYNEELVRQAGLPKHAVSSVDDFPRWKVCHLDGRPFEPDEYPIARALRGEEEITKVLMEYERGDGNKGFLSGGASIIRDSGGRPVAVVATRVDITELIQTQQELARSNAELQQFAYVASHDLQEPLRMVTSYLGLLERKYSPILDERAKEYMHFAVDGSVRMKELINDLLELTRIDAKAELRHSVDMNILVQKVLRSLEMYVKDSNATIEIDELPTINSDEHQMFLVMQNLISNAIKFRGKEDPRVKVSATADPKAWTFYVQDNGIGIDSAHHDKIFMVFQRLHGRDEYPGSGIGLAIVKKIVERHGGRVYVDSREGHGATFYFTIPRH